MLRGLRVGILLNIRKFNIYHVSRKQSQVQKNQQQRLGTSCKIWGDTTSGNKGKECGELKFRRNTATIQLGSYRFERYSPEHILMEVSDLALWVGTDQLGVWEKVIPCGSFSVCQRNPLTIFPYDHNIKSHSSVNLFSTNSGKSEVELSIKKIITKWIGKKHLKFLLFDHKWSLTYNPLYVSLLHFCFCELNIHVIYYLCIEILGFFLLIYVCSWYTDSVIFAYVLILLWVFSPLVFIF